VTVAHESADYLEDIVPSDKRESPTRMTLIWVTFIASVSNMYSGYLARADGLSLGQVMLAIGIGIVIVMAYGYCAANLGSATGQAHSVLTRGILGRWGSGLASVLLLITGLGWYGFQAYFLAQLLQGLFGIGHLAVYSAAFAMVMVLNNLLGFRGVAKFARMVAAPLLLVWGVYTVIKAFGSASGPQLFASPHIPVTAGILVTVTLLVGSAIYGNEPDVFRYARRDRTRHTGPLLIGYAMGIGIFPIAGYLMAELSDASSLGDTIQFFVHFSLFGLTGLAVVVFVVNQVALNDANLYEAVNAIQNVTSGRYRIATVLILGLIGAIIAVEMNTLDNNFFIVASITAVCLPCATLVMAVDLWLLTPISGVSRPVGPDGAPRAIVAWANSSPANIAGVVAILGGLAVGGLTGGLIPGLSGFNHTNIGIPALQGWATAVVLYVIGLYIARRLASDRQRAVLLGLPRETESPIDDGEAQALAVPAFAAEARQPTQSSTGT
jgi:purine-cytosine permease-like protein